MDAWIALVMVGALVEYFVLGFLVGRYRAKVLAPAMTGPPDFERTLRTQLNTAERLVSFLPALWLASTFNDTKWAAILGAAWLVGNTVYAAGYIVAAEKRVPGAVIRALAEIGLIGMAAWGVVRAVI